MTGHDAQCPSEEEAVLLALHALEPDQEARVARHVRTCFVCRATVRDVEETFADVAEATAVAPPPQLRQRILAAVQEDAPPVAVRVGPLRAAARRSPILEPVAAPRGPRRWLTGIAAALVVLGIAGGGIVWAQSQRDAGTVHASTTDDVLARITASPHAVLVDPTHRPLAAVVLADPSQFYALDLAPPPSGREWVLWGARGPDATALAAVSAGGDGGATPVSAGRQGDYEAYLLTQEPEGPLPTVHGQVLASGPFVTATR